MRTKIRKKTRLTMVALGVLLLSACSVLMSNNTGTKTISSSLMDFLYPDKESGTEFKQEIPLLKLPVTIGITFVPSKNGSYKGINSINQQELLERVKKSFVKYDYIERIEIIPSSYLKGEGFETLEQVSRLYDVDLMALVSYDQVTQSQENNAAFLYWTIVGMYLIPGNENSIQTFVDTAVFDVKSRKMLLRAPGISKLEKQTTAVSIDKTLSEKSVEGFSLAVDDMNTNLNDELARFKTRIKEEKIATVEHKKGYSGGGSMGYLLLVLAGLLKIKRQTVSKN